ncbi:MAG TPA: prepilin-type N-terminal cleavage/methylation domain-containing protein [Candidatus Limnocylindrales bacterium]|nr:prepilin-type N-terminal cleavage/methylation domain-containing protein [Candidatus Limnocylindrales bacterium]
MKQENILLSAGTHNKRRQRGFTLLELAIATLILMVGIVGVVQLVPASQQSNFKNRVDTTAMVFAQRELDQMINQPLTSATFTDADLRVVNLGSQTVTNTVFGGPVDPTVNPPTIDFTAAAVAGYNYTFQDPNDLTDTESATYQMRWAVISIVSGGQVVSKRFIVGCRRRGGSGNASQVMLPAVVDTLVQK